MANRLEPRSDCARLRAGFLQIRNSVLICKLVHATRAVLVCRKHVGGDAKQVLITDVGHLLAELARA